MTRTQYRCVRYTHHFDASAVANAWSARLDCHDIELGNYEPERTFDLVENRTPELINGRFRLLEPIGKGMSEVYSAEDLEAADDGGRRRVAVKLVTLDRRRPYSVDPEFDRLVKRFDNEVAIMRRLAHPGLPTVVDTGFDKRRRQPYLAMELIPGVTLSTLIEESEQPLPVRPVAAIGAQTADVLSAVHRANILHRDLKPGNVMVMPDGTVRVLDLGVGLALDSDAPRLTSTGGAVGSHHYMSPEQGGQRELTARSDLYNLGCLLYELLVGTPPFTGTSDIEVLRKHMTEAPAPLELMRRDLPEALTGLVDALLRKDPADRPADAATVAEALTAISLSAPAAPLPRHLAIADPSGLLEPSKPSTPAPQPTAPEKVGAAAAGMNVFELHGALIAEYKRFTSGGVIIKEPKIQNFIQDQMAKGDQWPAPFVALNPFFAPGGRVDELTETGVLHPECASIFQAGKTKQGAVCDGAPITLHRHQRDAIDIAASRGSYVITTGTGSGKSLGYIVPIVDRVLRDRESDPKRRGVRAIIVYPMNALANSQVEELEKFLQDGYPEGSEPVTFARYTGQEKDERRRQIWADPPDILLTNYVMLELLLTRPDDRRHLINAAQGLDFLVFDELHTYRGRQGADVAWLIRRVREACDAPDVQCVGTSATMSTEGGVRERKAKVAEVATTLFGTEITAEHVIGETLVRATGGDSQAVTAERISAPSSPLTYDDLAADPLATWIEEAFGIAEEDGQLVRRHPTTVEAAAAELARVTGCEERACFAAIRATLLAGSAAKHPQTGQPLFAFRLHQFLSKGDNVYATIESEVERHLTREYQVEQPRSGGKKLLPLVFCRDCGQEYLSVVRQKDNATSQWSYRARNDTDFAADHDDTVQTGYLYISTDEPWPSSRSDQLERRLIPASWLIEGKGGEEEVAKHHLDKIPATVRVSPDGREHAADGIEAAFIRGDFRFCLSCGITHEQHRARDFGKLAALNQEGRSSAASVISAKIIDGLKSQTGLDDEARKLLGFVDNRQDAALQAGHFNDFAQVVHLRGALVEALRQAEEEGLDDEIVAARVVDALGLEVKEYTGTDLDPRSRNARSARSALEKVVNFRLHLDLQRGWRVTMPNLEQTGLLHIEYADLGLIADWDSPVSEWSGRNLAFAGLGADVRAELMHTLLDEMRRSLAIDVACLDPSEFQTLKGTSSRLIEAWQLEDDDQPQQAIVYPTSTQKGMDTACVFMSPRGKMGRYLKRRLREEGIKDLKTADVQAVLMDLLTVLVANGLVTKDHPRRGSWNNNGPGFPDMPGYRVAATSFIWMLGDRKGIDDPLKVTRRDDGTRPPVNEYFQELYEHSAEALAGLRAREHTAQVTPEEREDREQAFRHGTLPLLYCSPTMELGVDIAQLNAVLMRNVPPTPANYAQRSGRAGRSGQQALVVTYCATGNSHDQYYFKRAAQMVSGAVAPPRLDLCNEDLILAHLQAIWIAEAAMRLGKSITEVVNTEGFDDDPVGGRLPLHSEFAEKALSLTARRRTLVVAERLLAPMRSELEKTTWWDDDWLQNKVKAIHERFDRAFDRWRDLFKTATVEYYEQNRRHNDPGLKRRDRDAAESRRGEAKNQLTLLRNEHESERNIAADFAPYRYLASEGFLPGYSFPRLPLAAYIPRRPSRIEGDYLQRSRFLAVREFGPGALIYHEGRQYKVNRVQLPTHDSGEIALRTVKRCPICAHAHDAAERADRCKMCDKELPATPRTNLLELRTVYTQRRQRISSDEEERRRAGYVLETSYRFNDHGERAGRLDTRLRDDKGEIGVLTYGPAATVRVANLRPLLAGPNKLDGYEIDQGSGKWLNDEQSKKAVGDATELADADDEGTVIKRRVVPYVEDHRNIAVLRLDHAVDPDTALSLMYALERGIEAAYQLEDAELSAELPTGDKVRTAYMLFVESSEGGAGVLRRFEDEERALALAAREALRICHFDPITGDDDPDTDCARGCYDCLLSYGNQNVHHRLNRHAALEILMRLARAKAYSAAAGMTRTDQHRALSDVADTDLERRFIDYLKQRGLRLPDHAQQLIEGAFARPDFTYQRPSGAYAVFVDGPVHDHANVAERDAEAEERLIDAGWEVIRFRYDDDWDDVTARYPEVFGTARNAADSKGRA